MHAFAFNVILVIQVFWKSDVISEKKKLLNCTKIHLYSIKKHNILSELQN